MGWPVLRYRDQLPPEVVQELDNLLAQLTAFLNVGHNEDGTTIGGGGATATSASQRIQGRASAGTGAIEALTLSQVLDFVGSAAQGDLLYRGATTWGRLPAGTSGLPLLTQGAAANPIYARAAYAAIQDISATSKFLGRKTAGAGVIEELSSSDVLTILGLINAGSAIYTGSGHPQAVLSAPIGSQYYDTVTGYLYRKMGGGSTAYGWYYVPVPGPAGTYGPQSIQWWPNPSSVSSPYQSMSNQTGIISQLIGGTNSFQNANTHGGPEIKMVSSTTIADGSRIFLAGATNFYMVDAGNGYDAVIHFRTDASLTGMRIWVKMGQSNDANADTMGGLGLGFRYSTVAGDAGFLGVSRDGVTQATWGQVGSNIAANTHYWLRMRQVGTTGYLSVNDGAETAVTTNLPVAGNAVGLFLSYFNAVGGVGTARTLYWQSGGFTFGGAWT